MDPQKLTVDRYHRNFLEIQGPFREFLSFFLVVLFLGGTLWVRDPQVILPSLILLIFFLFLFMKK